MPRPSNILIHRSRIVADREERTLTADMYCPELPAATEIAETTALPTAEPTRSLVVYVHDGVWGTGSTGQFARWALDAADRGFVATEVLCRFGHEAPFPAQIEDVCKGIDWLMDRTDKFRIGTDAVAVVGHSAGVHLTLLAALSDGEFGRRTDIDTAVGVSSVCDLRAGDYERAGESLPLFGNRPPTTELHRCSPITYVGDDTDADAGTPPTLLLRGNEGSVVTPDQSARLTDAFEGVGTQVGYDAVDAADHVFLHSSCHYPAVRKRAFSFLRESL